MMVTIDQPNLKNSGPTPFGAENERWQYACEQLLSAVSKEQAPAAERLLKSLHTGGCGLREWVNAIAWRGAMLPAEVPPALIEVYLNDPQAVPLHDCEDCGLAVPVRPSQLNGYEAEPDHAYFPNCPCCNGRTGWYMFWSTQADAERIPTAIQRRKAK